LFSYLILLTALRWMNLLKKWPCYWWMNDRVTSPVIWYGMIWYDMIGLLTEGWVGIMTFVLQTTQIFQVFDVTFFDILEQHPRYELVFGDEEVRLKCLMKIYHRFKQTLVDFNIWRAFQTLVLKLNARSESDKFLFNKEQPRQNVSFQGRSWMTMPCINCQLGGESLHWIGSMRQNKVIWCKLIDVSLIRYRDIVQSHKSEKWNYPEIHHIISKDLQRSRLFMTDWQEFAFYYRSMNISVSSSRSIFSSIIFFGCRPFRAWPPFRALQSGIGIGIYTRFKNWTTRALKWLVTAAHSAESL
jgi:hypothetical protein